MNKNYIIWGISNVGYQDSISSSFEDNIIPEELKSSVSDNHRDIADHFAEDNPNDAYFYSIERVGIKVLYTIYRTNFKGGSVKNRNAYDAATIIISEKNIIENPVNSLQLFIKSYITQKDSGFGSFDFEDVLTKIRLTANNDIRAISKTDKEGYIKYQSETELSSVFVDRKDKVHNFSKVYFFTRLNLLEEGEMKIQDLKDYKSIPVRLINYDAKYHRVFVEDKKVNPSGKTLDVYEGEEIKIKAEGNTPQVYIAKAGLQIILKEIVPPKQKTQSTAQEKRKRKEKTRKYIVIALCSVIISGASVLMLQEGIRDWFNSDQDEIVVKDTTKQVVQPIEENSGSKEDDKIKETIESGKGKGGTLEQGGNPDKITTENTTQPNKDVEKGDDIQVACQNLDLEKKWSSTYNELVDGAGTAKSKTTEYKNLENITKTQINKIEACSCNGCLKEREKQDFIKLKQFLDES